MAAVTLEHITRTYDKGRVQAVSDISFNVEEGELFGLIGPDGAGKTSLFRILATLLLADTGTASVAGYDVVRDYRSIRSCIGYMPGRFSLYQDLTVAENLAFFATVFGTTPEANYELIRDIYEQIKPFRHRRAGKLSGGMKQKLALCCALVHRPRVLLLDEPTTGVDVVSRKEFWDMLQRLKQQGITILVSTPYMDEAKLCGRIALLQQGRIMSVDTPGGIVQAFPATLYALRSADIYRLLLDMRAMPEVATCYPFGEYLHITLKKPVADGAGLLQRYAVAKGHSGVISRETAPGIEDSFIRLMQSGENGALIF